MLVGPAYALLYYGLFRFFIRRFNLPTPGREAEEAIPSKAAAGVDGEQRGAQFVAALGGPGNLASVGACTTRLRLIVRDQAWVDDARLKALGARGIIRPSANGLQVVLGPIADTVAAEMHAVIAADGGSSGGLASAPLAPPEAEAAEPQILPAILSQALGGSANILSTQRLGGRWRIEVKSSDAIIAADLDKASDGWAMAAPNVAHVVTG
jgi:PTS system N-acetylglucosamine-specific IIC component